MRLLRTFLLVVFVLGLLALDVSLALRRVETRKAEWSQEVLASVQKGLEVVADGLEQDLAVADALARWVSALPEVAPVLAGQGDAEEAARALDPLLDATPRLQRVELLTAAGARLAISRGPGGEPVLAPVAPGAPPPAPGPAEDEHGRLHLQGFFVAGSARAGVLAVLAPPPLPEHIAGFGNWQGARTRLLPPGATAAPDDGALVTLVRPLRRGSPWSLLGEVPATALLPPSDWRREQLVQTFAVLAGLTLLLLVVGATFLRLFARSTRLAETERYLRWIRRLTDRYRALMEGAADMVLIVDPRAGAVLESSAAARAALPLPDRPPPAPGARPDDAPPPPPPTPLSALFAGDALRLLQEALADALEVPGRSQALPEVRVTARDGSALLVDARIAAVDVGGEPLLQVSLRDLTQQKEIERRLATAGRLSSLGLLTAGVAHEINNPLEGIGNYLSLLEQDELPPARRAGYLAQVRHGVHRIRDIVADLLQFSRPQVGRGSVDLVAVVDRALSLAAYSKVLGGVRVQRHGLSDPLVVQGDAGRLEQVVLNLLLNAARATGEGAVLLSARVLPGDDGQLVELSVEDEGPGIRPEHLDRVFDPFFTTEGGTGLGLSVSYGIVQAHGGTLTAANRAGGGACFTLRLPADGGPARTAAPGAVLEREGS